MRKKLLTIFLPVVIAIACSIAVWASEPGAAQPACDKCAKVDKGVTGEKVAKDLQVQAAPGCDKCQKLKGAAAKPCAATVGDKSGKTAEECAKLKAAGKPCGGCAKSAKVQQTEIKPCCDKSKKPE